MPRPPNIVLVIADDHRADAFGGDRTDGPATPVLNTLVCDGTLFSGARIGGGDNAAVCAPSRAALFTGRPPREALQDSAARGYFDSLRIHPACPLLGEALRSAGHRTHLVGKWHNDYPALNRCFDSGEALFLGGMCNHDDPLLHDYDPTGAYVPGDARRHHGFSTEIFIDAAIRFVREAACSPQPFFLCVALTSPHDPRTAPREFRRRYRDEDMQLPANFMPEHPFDNGELDVRDETLAVRPRVPAEIKRHLADYHAMIEHHDHHLGRLFAALDETGEQPRTVIAYTSDHGLALGSHGLLGKQNLYEHSVRVPLVITGPGIPAGRKIPDDAYAYRLAATLAELAGSPAPEGAAPSLTPLFYDTFTRTPSPHFTHYRDRQHAVKLGAWKLVLHTDESGAETHRQLFNLANDPHELHDLSDEAAAAGRLSKLRALLRNWRS
ncbi:MAG: sulfatase-like hydrolase/transferase [Verrucomicrobiota bacterium]